MVQISDFPANKKKTVSVARAVEDIVGCKWSLEVLAAVRHGIVRPGAIQRHVEGLSTKVLNERLVKMQRYGIMKKEIFPEVPPRVEYQITPFGEQFLSILDRIEQVQSDLDANGMT